MSFGVALVSENGDGIFWNSWKRNQCLPKEWKNQSTERTHAHTSTQTRTHKYKHTHNYRYRITPYLFWITHRGFGEWKNPSNNEQKTSMSLYYFFFFFQIVHEMTLTCDIFCSTGFVGHGQSFWDKVGLVLLSTRMVRMIFPGRCCVTFTSRHTNTKNTNTNRNRNTIWRNLDTGSLNVANQSIGRTACLVLPEDSHLFVWIPRYLEWWHREKVQLD